LNSLIHASHFPFLKGDLHYDKNSLDAETTQIKNAYVSKVLGHVLDDDPSFQRLEAYEAKGLRRPAGRNHVMRLD